MNPAPDNISPGNSGPNSPRPAAHSLCDAPEPHGSSEAATVADSSRLTNPEQATLPDSGNGGGFAGAATALPVVDHLKIQRRIASGGMGSVYLANDLKRKAKVALKVMNAGIFASEEERKRFVIEAEAAAALQHPNIVTIFEIGDREGEPWFTMPMYEGGSLLDKIRATGAMAPREAAQLMIPLCRAMQHAHDRGVLHRDLKPGNVLLDASGQPVIVDFGLAKLMDNTTKLTFSGAVMGTASYMPPEQAGGEPATKACDVYSLGALFYHLLAGRPPFEAATPAETMRRVREELPARPSSLAQGLDRDLETVCLTCLEKRAADRYHSAAALADDLESWLNGRGIAARRPSLFEQFLKWSRRKPAWAAATGIAVVGVLAFIITLLINQFRLKQERDLTETVRQSAENLVGTAMTDYRQTVEATVGKIDALEQITQSVGDYFERLPPSLRDDRAESLRTRLLVLRGEIFTSQGRLNEAASVLDGAIAEAGKRARISAPTPPNAPPWPLVEAAALVSRTNVALRQDSPEAGSLAKRAIASARPVLPNTPAGGEAERLLGLALFFHGKCESKAGRPDAAQAALEESLALAQKVADSDGTNLQKQREHLWAMIELAKICKVRGAGVLKDLATGRKPSPTATTAPTGPDPKTEDASAARTRADSLLGKAQELYLSAKSTLEALSKLQPWNFPLRRDLGVVLDGLGDIALTWKKDPASAISYYQQYLANSIDLSAHDPENLEWKKETIVAHRALAGTFHAMRQQEEAFKHFDQAISMREHLIAQDPSDAKLLRDHCDTLLDRGDARFGAKMFDGAKADYTAAENIAMNAEKSDKEPAWWENRRVGIHFRWGALHLRQEPDGASAKERLALAVALAERLKTQGTLTATGEEAGRTAASLLRRLQTPASNESSPAPQPPPGPPPSPQPGGEK